MATHRQNQCRRAVWLALLVAALVCTFWAYLDTAWVVTQNGISPIQEIGLLKKVRLAQISFYAFFLFREGLPNYLFPPPCVCGDR